ncbi:hypothetical protein [Micromonospora carbonacea]|uniref:hypothetical protein n=1 Tax=Micromonospora carbonacea TaxID=47853 RepID=UPI00159F111A|nr:hypothetical protein [Micromonospora carbonacea]
MPPTPTPPPSTGRKAYGVSVAPSPGCRNNRTNGIAKGRPARGQVRHPRRHAELVKID